MLDAGQCPILRIVISLSTIMTQNTMNVPRGTIGEFPGVPPSLMVMEIVLTANGQTVRSLLPVSSLPPSR